MSPVVSQSSSDVSLTWEPNMAAEVSKLQLRPHVKTVFYVGAIQRICLVSDAFCSGSTAIVNNNSLK
jgi:hypothetical protein